MKKYTITVIDNETGKPAEVNGKPIQADTDVLLIAWGEENGVREVGLNQNAWSTKEKRQSAIRALLEMADNLCGGPDEEAATDALAGFLAYVTEVIEKRLSPKGGAALCMHMAEELARRACMETEAKA